MIQLNYQNLIPLYYPKNLTDLDSFEFDGLEGKTNLREMLDSSYTDAFVILKDSKIIFEEYQNEMKDNDLHLMNSVSKSFVGMLLGILQNEAKLSTTDKVIKYIPELQNLLFKKLPSNML